MSESYSILIKKDGYVDKTYTITSSVDSWYFGNIIFGRLTGILIVGPATGAMYSLPDRGEVSLDIDAAAEADSHGKDKASGNTALSTQNIDALTADQVARLIKLN